MKCTIAAILSLALIGCSTVKPTSVAHEQDGISPIHQIIREFTKTTDGWDAVNRASDPFVIVRDHTTYTVHNGKIVDVTLHMHAIWNPKWLDNAQQLTRAIGQPITNEEGIYAVCYKKTASDPGSCNGVPALPNTKLWTSSDFNVIVYFDDGTVESHMLWALAARGAV